jgi:hypothetical protein
MVVCGWFRLIAKYPYQARVGLTVAERILLIAATGFGAVVPCSWLTLPASPYFLLRWHSLNAFSHAIRFRV